MAISEGSAASEPGSATRVQETANGVVYAARDVVETFSTLEGLQQAERTILGLFRNAWAGWDFLDVGVGAGRTTPHFAPLVKSYVGLDYSEGMIRACREKFGHLEKHWQFLVCDARRMSVCTGQTFDFVLFSYNGIDYVGHEDRLQILREIRRVLRPGGWLCFSSHNLRFLSRLFRLHFSVSPRRMWHLLQKYRLLRAHNPNHAELQRCQFAVINDGALDFRLQTYYIAPEAQIAQLEETGFQTPRIVSGDRGQELSLAMVAKSGKDCWLYYVSQR